MDIPDYLLDPNPDGKEWIKRKVLTSRWELRRTIEEVEFFAKKYQMKKKYGDELQELPEIERSLKNLFERSRQLAVQIRDMSS
jgi:hypothetical protein